MLYVVVSERLYYYLQDASTVAAPVMRPDSLPRLWRYINLLLTCHRPKTIFSLSTNSAAT